ncbi:MAG: hypothetical protein QOD42_1958 [Sphingomonadales bacterium]|jgi:uncharacterized protein YigE (DUF2233 family)|nr:hypothetical protein [Sphingomonadales bacterium]
MPRLSSPFLALALALAACGPAAQAPDAPAETASACERRAFEGSTFTVCRYDRRRHNIVLVLDDSNGRPLRSFAALEIVLGPRARRLLFAMNAGMYDEAGGPIGLYVEQGRERHAINRRPGAGNFHLLPNGVFTAALDGRVAIVPADRYDPASRPFWATQSGPMLVIDGALHPAVQADGPSLHIRNGVCVVDENVAWFAISEAPVSFGRLARLFRDRLGCRNALYLDGSVSSLWDRPAWRRDGYSELGPLVAVFAKEEERR